MELSILGIEGPISVSQQELHQNFLTNSNENYLSRVAQCVPVSQDPFVLIDDWRFHEGDQIANIEFKNGNKYIGRLSRNVMHGEGEFIWANGTVYKVILIVLAWPFLIGSILVSPPC